MDQAKAARPDFSFGVIADAQYCDKDSLGTRDYRASADKLEACVADLNSRDLAFVVDLGDVIDERFESFGRVVEIYSRLEAPRYHVLGNHDFEVSPEKKDHVPQTLGMERRYHDFVRGPWRFVVLDGNDVSVIAANEGSDTYRQAEAMLHGLEERGAPNAMEWNGAIGTDQLDWLGRTLAKASGRRERVVVLCHFPVYPPGVHNLWNDSDVLEVTASHDCIVAWLCGHNHGGNYAEKDGVHHLAFSGLVQTSDTTAYAVIDVYSDRLEVLGVGREPSRVLKV